VPCGACCAHDNSHPHRTAAGHRRAPLVLRRADDDQGRRRRRHGHRADSSARNRLAPHVHDNEDEWFYVLEGELAIRVDGETHAAPAGSFVFGPRDIPHTFIVSSEIARFLLVTEPGDFAGFIRALAEPAPGPELPPGPPAPPDMELVIKTAAEYGLEILGPPGIPG
jgi:mannose-6-phosphate isomerase-like protein (cupin superfamily)